MPNLPVLVTLSRVALIPALILLVALEAPGWLSGSVFVAAWLTDWLDGHLARARDETSRFGAFLDPVADKLLVGSMLIMVAWQQSSLWFSAPAALIIFREMSIMALREWMAVLGRSDEVAVSGYGKFKTALEFVALTIFLFLGTDPDAALAPLAPLAWLTLYIATLLALFSMLRYFQAALGAVREPAARKRKASG